MNLPHLPALFFGVILSTFLGVLAHLILGGGLGRLIFFIVASWIGFWVGHFVAEYFNFELLPLGPLNLGMAIPACLAFLLIAHWLSMVDVEGKK